MIGGPFPEPNASPTAMAEDQTKLLERWNSAGEADDGAASAGAPGPVLFAPDTD